jgi:hypothetical protein
VPIDVKATVVSALIGGPSVFAAVVLAAPAMAEPATADPVTPGPVIAVAAPAAPDGAVQPAAVGLPTPPDGMPHLSSPENLPPGTTDTPPDADQPRGLTYLQDIWHAYQTQEVSGKDALLLLTQRPMDADAVPPPGMYANPTPPTAPLPIDAPPPPEAPVVP